jgi:dTMP kinase
VTARYVALEGVEGAGKSTVAHLLADRLREIGHTVVVVREPGGTTVGEEIRRLLLHEEAILDWTEAALFAASRAELVHRVVGPALERGEIVLSDRTYYSSLAYQGGARGLGVDEVRALNEQVLTGFLPDLVVVLDVDPEVGFAREVGRDRIGAEGLEFQRNVAEAYRKIGADDPRVFVISADRPSDVIVDEILGLMEQR